jgi:hypothetical protein
MGADAMGPAMVDRADVEVAEKHDSMVIRSPWERSLRPVTSLAPEAFPTADVLALYRLRWRIDPRVKPGQARGLIDLKGPPGVDEPPPSLTCWPILIILLLEPLLDGIEDSPRWAEGLPLVA